MSTTTVLTHSSAAAQTRPRPTAAWLGFMVVIASSVMDLLDSTIAQTAAPAIHRDLGESYASLEWISAAYTLAMSAMLLLGSRLGDVLGRRRVLLGGIGGFVGASALCALAPSSTALITGRAVQGAIAAIMVPQGFGLIRELFGDEGQQKAFGVFGPVMGLAAVAGPLLGGGLIDLDLLGTGWRAIFLINVPLGLAAIAAGRRFLPRVAPATPGVRLDVTSVLLAVLGSVGLVYPLIEGRALGWPAWSFVVLLAGAVTLSAFAALQSRRARQGRPPLVEPSLLRRRPYVAGLAVVVGFIGAMGGMMIALNVMFQTGLGFTPLACGVATVAIPTAAIGGSVTSSMLLARIGRATMQIGIVTMALGLVGVDLALRSAGGAVTGRAAPGGLGLGAAGVGAAAGDVAGDRGGGDGAVCQPRERAWSRGLRRCRRPGVARCRGVPHRSRCCRPVAPQARSRPPVAAGLRATRRRGRWRGGVRRPPSRRAPGLRAAGTAGAVARRAGRWPVCESPSRRAQSSAEPAGRYRRPGRLGEHAPSVIERQ